MLPGTLEQEEDRMRGIFDPTRLLCRTVVSVEFLDE